MSIETVCDARFMDGMIEGGTDEAVIEGIEDADIEGIEDIEDIVEGMEEGMEEGIVEGIEDIEGIENRPDNPGILKPSFI